ncbi:hypothetical protein [Streptomyces scopuliridis]|uniref:hypothetical protein n=1 Tax=Streptomyces scopuliridis TaxID=452529 RepID=UPI0036C550AE
MRVADLIVKKLALENVSSTWRRAGNDTPGAGDRRAVVEAAADRDGLAVPEEGLRRPGRRIPARPDLRRHRRRQSPHVLVCSGTGGGTTTILRTLTAQLLHHGSHALVLDLKRISHRWASGVPGITYCRDIAGIHDALVGLRAELQHRLDRIEQHGDVDDLPRLTVVFEVADTPWGSWPATGTPSARRETPRRPRPSTPSSTCSLRAPRPASTSWSTPRSPTAFLGAEGRELFSTVVLGRVTTRTWKRLAPQVHPAPEPNTHPGHVHVVQDFTVRPTQVLLLTDDEAAAGIAATETEED